jgi:hypothetical protein
MPTSGCDCVHLSLAMTNMTNGTARENEISLPPEHQKVGCALVILTNFSLHSIHMLLFLLMQKGVFSSNIYIENTPFK